MGVLKTLLDRRLLRIAGRKAVVGKPFLYATTREFLVHFGLDSLDDLPPLEEFEETFGEGGDFGAGRRLGGGVESVEPVEPKMELAGFEEGDREETIRREAAAIEEAELMSAARASEPGEQ